ncbi:putative Dual specificity protein phosphatase CDC14A [Blattamonas nauphoetae]|uniref:Dual specificity protein phosphatase CDC14A n=1 Tax=Blattamonas nauphoetae TaxID=2049346 RepID=A0ABQ9XPL5_9EUKA|nr:putative Dual specificity protein phosphatase CDC14A [Blattamonas nauphoetae]
MTSSQLDERIEIIKGKLYYVSLLSIPEPNDNEHFFCTDSTLIYHSFSSDFGPLNLSCISRFCTLVQDLVQKSEGSEDIFYYYSSFDSHKRANAVFLMCCFMVLCLHYSPEDAFQPFNRLYPPLPLFRDASSGLCTFNCSIVDCLQGLVRGVENGFFDLNTFDYEQYEYFERIENGEMNWVIPGKILAFASPTQSEMYSPYGVTSHTPIFYSEVFHQIGITAVVRLNNKLYDRNLFLSRKIHHYDLYFDDGSVPSMDIVHRFLAIAEREKGIAVHCKAGLGRTGTLIACYLMKHHNFSAMEAITFIRICRPGSIVGGQQHFIVEVEEQMKNEGIAGSLLGATAYMSPNETGYLSDSDGSDTRKHRRKHSKHQTHSRAMTPPEPKFNSPEYRMERKMNTSSIDVSALSSNFNTYNRPPSITSHARSNSSPRSKTNKILPESSVDEIGNTIPFEVAHSRPPIASAVVIHPHHQPLLTSTFRTLNSRPPSSVGDPLPFSQDTATNSLFSTMVRTLTHKQQPQSLAHSSLSLYKDDSDEDGQSRRGQNSRRRSHSTIRISSNHRPVTSLSAKRTSTDRPLPPPRTNENILARAKERQELRQTVKHSLSADSTQAIPQSRGRKQRTVKFMPSGSSYVSEHQHENDVVIIPNSGFVPRTFSRAGQQRNTIPTPLLSPTFDLKSSEQVPVTPRNTDHHFSVVLRVRPPLDRELEQNYVNVVSFEPDGRTVRILDQTDAIDSEIPYSTGHGIPSSQTRFRFDRTFSCDSTQEEVFNEIAVPIINSALNGINGTILAYGQTGAGKTYTIEGENVGDKRGLIPRTMEYIFDHIQQRTRENNWYELDISYLEIYKETIYDLLAVANHDQPSPRLPSSGLQTPRHSSQNLPLLPIREDSQGNVYVEGLSEWRIKSLDDVNQLLQIGYAQRTFGATRMNERSSRSHAVFSVLLCQHTITEEDEPHTRDGRRTQAEVMRVSKLNLVDLAGCERMSISHTDGIALEEMKKINLSLSCLGNVVAALTSRRPRSHIPYRDSKLTRLLQDSLGGNTRTVFIALISPSAQSLSESLSTLKFAQRARQVENKPVVNEKVEASALIRKYEKEIKRLQGELDRAQAGGKRRSQSAQDWEGERTEIATCRDLISRQAGMMGVLTHRLSERDAIIKQLSQALDSSELRAKDLERTMNKLLLQKGATILGEEREEGEDEEDRKKDPEEQITDLERENAGLSIALNEARTKLKLAESLMRDSLKRIVDEELAKILNPPQPEEQFPPVISTLDSQPQTPPREKKKKVLFSDSPVESMSPNVRTRTSSSYTAASPLVASSGRSSVRRQSPHQLYRNRDKP